jgi:hypothetical protein
VEKEPPQAFPSGAATQRGLYSSLLTHVDFSEAAILAAEGLKGKVTEHVTRCTSGQGQFFPYQLVANDHRDDWASRENPFQQPALRDAATGPV